MGTFCGEDIEELFVLFPEDRGLTAPDDTEIYVTVEQSGFWGVGVIDFDLREPSGEEGFGFFEVFWGDVIGRDS